MFTGIDRLLLKTTGPSCLCSDLQLKTKSVHAILNTFNSLSALQTAFPSNVLGSDIFALLRGRLKQYVLFSEKPEGIRDSVPIRKHTLTPQPNLNIGSNKGGFGSNIVQMKEKAWPLSLRETTFRDQDRSFPYTISGESETAEQRDLGDEPGNLINMDSSKKIGIVDQPDFGTDSQEATSLYPILAKQSKSSKSGESFFSRKLKDYWRLNHQDQNPLRGKDQNSMLTGPVVENVRARIPAFAIPPNSAQSPHSWPEATGRGVAQKIRSLDSDREVTGASKHARQSIPTDSHEKVEIHNVFNIEVKSDGDKVGDSTTTLSEKIADILREQALQHGIDIT